MCFFRVCNLINKTVKLLSPREKVPILLISPNNRYLSHKYKCKNINFSRKTIVAEFRFIYLKLKFKYNTKYTLKPFPENIIIASVSKAFSKVRSKSKELIYYEASLFEFKIMSEINVISEMEFCNIKSFGDLRL